MSDELAQLMETSHALQLKVSACAMILLRYAIDSDADRKEMQRRLMTMCALATELREEANEDDKQLSGRCTCSWRKGSKGLQLFPRRAAGGGEA
jgi:hypothetical protein